MIKTLRRKFIAITMVSVVLVLCGLIGTMDILNYHRTMENIRSEMEILKSNGGDLSEFKTKREFDFQNGGVQPPQGEELPPEPEDDMRIRMSQEIPFSLRYFTATVSGENEVVSVNTNDIISVDESTAKEVAQSLVDSDKTVGFYHNYYYDTMETSVNGQPATMYP